MALLADAVSPLPFQPDRIYDAALICNVRLAWSMTPFTRHSAFIEWRLSVAVGGAAYRLHSGGMAAQAPGLDGPQHVRRFLETR